jgi:hypothetical protein
VAGFNFQLMEGQAGGGASVTRKPAGPEAEDQSLSVRPAIGSSCEKLQNAARCLSLNLEVKPQEQIDHAICRLVVKEPSGE